MADKVYQGGIPQGGFDAQQSGSLSVSSASGSSETPGGPAGRPGVVKQGGSTPAKDGKVSNEFEGKEYRADSMRPGKMDIDNPDDISHADHDTDEDHPNK